MGVRAYFLVALTSIHGMYLVEKKNRLLIYSAGMIVDLTIASIGIVSLWLVDKQIILLDPLLYKFIQQIVLLEWLGILWQFFFFMKTDIYYIFSDIINYNDILDDTIKLIKNYLLKIIYKQSKNKQQLSKKKRVMLMGYSLFFTLGIFLIWIRFFTYFIPINVQVYTWSFHEIMQGFTLKRNRTFAKGILVVLIETLQISLMFYLNFKKIHRKNLLPATVATSDSES